MARGRVMAKRNTSTPALQARPEIPLPSALSPGVLAGAALIVVAACLAYFPSLRGEFILDDNMLLTDNPLIKASDGLYRFWCTTEPIDYWPVSNTTLWIEWRLWGMHSTGYHVTNLVLHVVAALLIWVVLGRLSIPGAFLAALLFAVHPVNVESVAWVGQRKSLLALLFFLLSILWYVKAETASRLQARMSLLMTDRWYWLSLVGFILAMLSKVSVAVLPLILLLIVWWVRPLTRRDLVRMTPFLLAAVVLLRVNLWFRTHGIETEIRSASYGFTERLLGAVGVVWFYLYKALLPVNLIFLYPEWHVHADQWQWWLPLVAAVATTCVLWRYRRGWSRPPLLAWGYFCVALVPVMGFSDVGFMQPLVVADHYQDVALIGVVALVSAGWATWQRRVHGQARWALNAVAVAVAGMLSVLTWQQSSLYSNAMKLYQATLEKNPDSSMAHNNLGFALLQAGRPQEAMGHFEQALRVTPDYFDARNNLGFALLEAGRPQEASTHVEQALRIEPNSPQANYNMGRVLFQTGRLQEAIEYDQRAVRLKPDFPEAQYDLGVALAQAGQLQEAIGHYQQALRLKPDYPEAHYNLGTALVRARQLQDAIEHYQQALQLKPDYAEAHNNLGGVLFETGRPQEAIAQYEQALRLKPDFPEAHSNLGRALLQARQLHEAIEHFQRAVQLTPDSPEAHNDLGVALTDAGQLQDAIGHFQQALQLKPDYSNARSNLQEALAMQERAAKQRE